MNPLLNFKERTGVVIRNIVASFGVKGFSIIISLMLVPLTIDLLSVEKYGIWITIFSIVSWFSMMDIGLGHGFKNRFSESLSQNSVNDCKSYLKVFYQSMALISLIIILVSFLAVPVINWRSILNLSQDFDENITIIILMVFTLFAIQLFTKNISFVLLAFQKTALSNSIMLISNIISLCVIYLFKIRGINSLFYVALVFMISPIIVYSLTTLILYQKQLRSFFPSFDFKIDSFYLKKISGIGLIFFIIQLTTIVVYSSANIIIANLYGPSDVSVYNTSFQLFATIQGVFTIIIAPFWVAFNEAYYKKDILWIKHSFKKLLLVWLCFTFGTLVVYLYSDQIFSYWIGHKLLIPKSLSFQFFIFTTILTFQTIFMHFINGVGKIRLNLIISLIQMIIAVPMAVFLAKFLALGINGIALSININLFFSTIFITIQSFKIINSKAKGIWNF